MKIDEAKMKLSRETRWHRKYALEEPKSFYMESKFRDGSASITLAQLEAEWPKWSDSERVDFCQEVGSATFPYLPDILRFVMRHGEVGHWSAIALDIVAFLPADEAIPFLKDAYVHCEIGHAANILQALSKSGAPEAHKIHRAYLEQVWVHADLLKQEQHINGIASEAVFCIAHLLGLGEPAAEFEDKFKVLASHPNEVNREMAKGFLGKYFGVPPAERPDVLGK